jgi:hypothetical protein
VFMYIYCRFFFSLFLSFRSTSFSGWDWLAMLCYFLQLHLVVVMLYSTWGWPVEAETCCDKRLYKIKSISVAIAGIYENCSNLAQLDAPLTKITLLLFVNMCTQLNNSGVVLCHIFSNCYWLICLFLIFRFLRQWKPYSKIYHLTIRGS